MDENKKKVLKEWDEMYRRTLLDDVIPWWMKHSPDRKNGGYYHQLDYDGSILDTEKYMWPQNREIWIFSMLYNEIEKKPEWLDMAKLGIDFLKKHGRDENGDWYMALTATGKPVIQPYNIFSDCFAVIAFSEYAKASGDDEALDIALKTYNRIQARKDNPKGKYNKIIAENRPFKNLAIPMINCNITSIINAIKPDPEYDRIIDTTIKEVFDDFCDEEYRVIHENVRPDGTKVDSIDGRHVNPGHGIEAMWFIMRAAEKKGDKKTINKAKERAKWCIEFGWDREYKGIYYFMDKMGKSHFELQWDMKLWWPHLEAMNALLLAYQLTGDEECWNWNKKVHDYAWAHFPDKENGEWYGYLNRRGEVNNRTKSNRWKCCFHLPRTLVEIPRICRDILAGE